MSLSPPLSLSIEDMNHAAKAGAFGCRSAPLLSSKAVSFFHSTPVLERGVRRNRWNPGMGSFNAKRFNYYAKRRRNFESKSTLFNNISNYAEYLFQSWKDENENENEDTSWFRMHHFPKGGRKYGFGSHEPQWGSSKRKGGFEFCSSDNDEAETIFRGTFGGDQYFYWSFGSSEYSHSDRTNNKNSWNWRYQTDDDDDDSCLQSDLASERVALGLSASGPLKLDEIKSAYRACALRWHPDRHQGSSKVTAEEKFKHCSAAYKSLCDKFALV